MSDLYQKLLERSEQRAAALERELAEARAQSARGEAERDGLRDARDALQRELDEARASIARLARELAVASAEAARLRHYPDAYPGFAEAGRFFADALAHERAPFLGMHAPSALDADRFAARHRAYLGRTPCTVRLARVADDDAPDAWARETRHAIALALAPPNAQLATVLATGEPERPGFVVCTALADDLPTIDRLAATDRAGLSINLERTLSFLQALEARARARVHTLLPDARAVAVIGRELFLLEPTATHAGDLTPLELHQVAPRELDEVTGAALQSAWVAAGALLLMRIWGVPVDGLLTGIARDGQRAREPYPLDARTQLRELLERAAGPAAGRPTLAAFRHALRALLDQSASRRAG